ncbi:MAG: AMP-binding protein [Alphaproteobacteria bacterium]
MAEAYGEGFRRSAFPSREDCVLSALLDKRVSQFPDKTFAVFDSGPSWSYREVQRQARRTAVALGRLGVGRDHPVLVWLPNGPDIVRISIALSYLGAVFVPINLALRGQLLGHVVQNSAAQLMICHADLVERLSELECGTLKTLVVVGGEGRAPSSFNVLGEGALESDSEDYLNPIPVVEPWDIGAILYTSGTTGPSKGVLCPHVLTYATGVLSLHFLRGDDRFLLNLPYYHMGGLLVAYAMLDVGGSIAVVRDFSTREFWSQIRRMEATSCYLLGPMADFLMKQPPGPDDTRHTLRTVLQQPLIRDVDTFTRRFGITIYTGIDMTEMGSAIISDVVAHTMPHGYCGRHREGAPHMEVRLVDAFDRDVDVGEVGELVARSDVPWVITPGYHRMPEATAAAWRNGWFHTGDLMRTDAAGNYYFVDRKTDSIRRRGESISSAEVEREVLAFDAVEAAAAVAARGDDGEEVLVAVQPKPGCTIDPKELIAFLLPRMAHFMVPRFVRVMAALPKTQTGKIQKSVLRKDGVTEETWDRETAGIVVRRERIGHRG